ncbi:HEAT repeat domain-containing protein [Natronoglomus mannanivorans]|uniref:HEAT repeat domain-containing protein n=1 Tax=Natronoglomus mannanivorans TaxID=2979990 RepID=A0AAP3E4A0_9EURY|nr:HEAT repeat domain-containing protein [Halobacteria archaeon AArc-xg1-1]
MFETSTPSAPSAAAHPDSPDTDDAAPVIFVLAITAPARAIVGGPRDDPDECDNHPGNDEHAHPAGPAGLCNDRSEYASQHIFSFLCSNNWLTAQSRSAKDLYQKPSEGNAYVATSKTLVHRMLNEGGETDRASPTPAKLHRRVRELEELNENFEQATRSVQRVVRLIQPELQRDFAAVDSFSGKEATSVEICELGVDILAGVATEHPDEVGSRANVLVRALSFEPSDYVRSTAANALHLVAEAQGESLSEILPTVIDSMNDPDWKVRHHTTAIVTEMPKAAAEHDGIVSSLKDGLEDPNWLVRAESARAVWNLADAGASHVRMTRSTLLTCLGDEEPRVRRLAGSALAATAADDVENVIDLVERLICDHDQPRKRAGAIRCANGLCTNYPESAEVLTDALVGSLFDSDERVRSAAADVLETFARYLPDRRDNLIDQLVWVLNDSEWTVTTAAAQALAILAEGRPERADELIHPLMNTLEHDSTLARFYSGQSIASFVEDAPETADIVETELTERLVEDDLELKKSVASVLFELDPEGQEHAKRVTRSLIEKRDDSQSDQRTGAAAGLAVIAFTNPDMLAEVDPVVIARPLEDEFISVPEPERVYIRQMTASTVLFAIQSAVFSTVPGVVQSAVEELIAIDPTSNREMRVFGTHALGQETTIKHCEKPETVIRTLAQSITDAEKEVRSRAAAGLLNATEHYPTLVAPYVDALEEGTRDSYFDCRSASTTAIGELGAREPALAERCLKTLEDAHVDDHWQVEVAAYGGFEVIAEIAPEKTGLYLGSLVDGLASIDENVQTSAADAITAILRSDATVQPDPSLRDSLRASATDSTVSDFVRTIVIELVIRTTPSTNRS